MAAGWVVDVRMGRRRGGDGERRFEGATNRAGAGKPRTWEDTNKYLKTNLRNVVKIVGNATNNNENCPWAGTGPGKTRFQKQSFPGTGPEKTRNLFRAG